MNKNKLQRNLSLVLALSLLAPTVTALPVFAEIPENKVEASEEEEYSIEDKFTDANIKEKVKEQLGLDKTKQITNKNILKLEKLDISAIYAEATLDGLEYAENLKTLIAGGVTIITLTPLKSLEKLEELECSGYTKTSPPNSGYHKGLKESESLKHLKYLKKLKIQNEEPGILENIGDMRELRYLDLQGNNINNINNLKNIKNLQYLDLSSNKITDITPLESLEMIQALKITHNEVRDITPLQGKQNLKTLELNDNEIEKIDALKTLQQIENLELSNNKIKNIESLQNLNNIKYLGISSNEIKDLRPIQNLSKLENLFVYSNQITDISAIKTLKNLKELDLSYNMIEDVTALQYLQQITDVYLGGNKIKRINFKQPCESLKNFSIEDNKIEQFDNLSKFLEVESFYMDFNNLEYTMQKRFHKLFIADMPIRYFNIVGKDRTRVEITENTEDLKVVDNVLWLGNNYEEKYKTNNLEILYGVDIKYFDENTQEEKIGQYYFGRIYLDTSNLQPAQALTYTPETTLLQVEKDSKEVDYKKGISNLQEGAEVTPLEGENPDLTKVGKKTVKVKITLEDGSYLDTEIPIEVKITPTEIKPIEGIAKENIEPEIIKVGDQIDLTDNIKNLPEGTQVKDITEPKIDTTKSGKYTATVEITYKDGSGITIEIPVEIKDLESNKYNPEITVPKIEVKTGEKVNLKDLIEKTPEIKEIIEIKPIDTETEGLKEGKVKIIFNDGSEKEIPIKVEIKLKDKLPDNPVLPSNPETPTNPEITTPVIPFKPVEDTFHYGEIRIIDHTDTQKSKEKESIKPEEKDNKSELDKIKADLEKEDKQITKKNQIIFKIGESSYKKLIAGKEEVKQMDIAPFIEKDRTYLPIRNVAEALGLEVSYDNNTRTATFKQNNDTLQINIDTKKATKNGKPYVLEVDPIIKNGRLVAPVSVIGKAFNKTVSNITEDKNTDIVWNNDTKEVIIYNFI